QKVPADASTPQDPIVQGERTTIISHVLPEMVAIIDEYNEFPAEDSVFGPAPAPVPPEDDILSSLQERQRELYDDFIYALIVGNLIYEDDAAAYPIFQQLIEQNVDNEILRLMKRKLSGALQNSTQTVINDYVNGIIPKVKKEQREYFMLASNEMELLMELRDESDPFYNSYSARKLFFQGRSKLITRNKDEIRKAIELLKYSLQLEPSMAYTHNAVGIALGKIGRNDEAITHYLNAIQLAPIWAFPYANLALIYKNRGEFEKATEYFEKALSIDSTYTSAVIGLGSIASEQYDYQVAINYYNRALDYEPENIHAMVALGTAYRKLAQFETAMSFYTKALLIDDNSPEIYYRIAELHNHRGRLEEAIKYFKIAIEKDKYFSHAYYSLGLAYSDLQHYESAAKYIEKYLEMEPHDLKALRDIGWVYVYQQNFELAELNYKMAIAIDSTDFEAYFGLGCLYMDLRQLDEAKKYFDQTIINIGPDNRLLILNLAHIYYNGGGDLEIAATYFEKGPTLYTEVLTLATIYFTLENYSEALINFEWVASFHNYRHLKPVIGMGLCYMYLGKFNESEDFLKRAIKLNKRNPVRYFDLAACYSYFDQNKKAIKMLKRALRKGFDDYTIINTDPLLDNIREEEKFKKLVKKYF
ncbi:MAG: tetratricopeptide repeat protein, partial [Bacteroidetes bacterium]|nr:tetratricopeptide repeat protein [Bacteroidota bacterium]